MFISIILWLNKSILLLFVFYRDEEKGSKRENCQRLYCPISVSGMTISRASDRGGLILKASNEGTAYKLYVSGKTLTYKTFIFCRKKH